MQTAPRDLFDVLSPPDPIDIAHEQGNLAAKLFVRPATPPPPPAPPPDVDQSPGIQDAIRGMSIAKKVETMSARVARGLPPEPPPPPSPFVQFGNELHPVHIEAIKQAILSAPEEARGDMISGVHDQVAQWIHDNNGRVIVDGKIEVAQNPKQVTSLAAKIVNDVADTHDQTMSAKVSTSASGAANSKQESLPRTEIPPTAQPSETASGSSFNASPGSARIAASPPTSAQGKAIQSPDTSDTTQPVGGQSLPVPSAGEIPMSGASSAQPTLSPKSVQPEIVPPGDNSPPPEGTPPEVKPEELADVGEKDDTTGRAILQPKDKPEENKKLALDAAPELHDALSQIASQIPGARFVRIRPVKSDSRIDEKVSKDGKPPETLADYLGAQIAVDTPQAKEKVADALRKNFNVVEENDKFLEGRPQKAGYPSLSMQVQMSNGSSAQVQVVAREVQDMDTTTHPLYKAGRDAELAGDNATRDKHWNQAKQIHDDAIARFKQRNADQANRLEQHLQAGGFITAGKPFTVAGKTFIGVHPEPAGILSDASQPPESVPEPPVAPQEPSEASSPTAEPATSQGSASEEQQATEAVPQQIIKGSRVRMEDGSLGEVKYLHNNMNIARVKVGRKTVSTNLNKLKLEG